MEQAELIWLKAVQPLPSAEGHLSWCCVCVFAWVGESFPGSRNLALLLTRVSFVIYSRNSPVFDFSCLTQQRRRSSQNVFFFTRCITDNRDRTNQGKRLFFVCLFAGKLVSITSPKKEDKKKKNQGNQAKKNVPYLFNAFSQNKLFASVFPMAR